MDDEAAVINVPFVGLNAHMLVARPLEIPGAIAQGTLT